MHICDIIMPANIYIYIDNFPPSFYMIISTSFSGRVNGEKGEKGEWVSTSTST